MQSFYKFLDYYLILIHLISLPLQPEGMNLTPKDVRWIGAWWLGYVIGVSVLILSAIGLLGFPRELPGAREMREKAMKAGELQKHKEEIKGNLKVNILVYYCC